MGFFCIRLIFSPLNPLSVKTVRGTKLGQACIFLLHFNKNMCIQFLCAVLAQLVEQRIRNAWVGGSTPLNGTIFISNFLYLLALVATLS